MKWYRALTLSIAIICTVTGCSTSNKEAHDDGQLFFVHSVQYQGETLELLSLWYTGSVYNLAAIRDANKKLSENELSLGIKVNIPRLLLTTNRLLPKDYIQRQVPPASTPPHQSLNETQSIPTTTESIFFNQEEAISLETKEEVTAVPQREIKVISIPQDMIEDLKADSETSNSLPSPAPLPNTAPEPTALSIQPIRPIVMPTREPIVTISESRRLLLQTLKDTAP